MTLLTQPNYNSLFPNWMEFDRWDNFFQDPYHSSGAGLEQRPRNKYRWDETNEEYKIDIVMPGVTKKDIDVTFKDDTLSIKCNKDVSENDQSFFGVKSEQAFKNFPSAIDTDNILAEMGDGILTVTLPKKESDKPKSIEIRQTNIFYEDIMRYNVSEDEVEAIDRNDWVEKVYYEDGVKITRFKPVWWKDPEGLTRTEFKGKPRKPTFGPTTPINSL